MLKIFKEGFENLFKDIREGNLKKQLANLLTLSRLFSPFILIPLIAFNKNILFIIFIIIFSLTDTFDGYFARKYKSYSLFGKYLDAFVDKIYIGSLLFPIVLFPWLDNSLVIIIWIILGFELLISISNLYSFYHKLNPYSSFIGKIKTAILFITMGFIYLKKFIYISSNIILYLLIILLLLEFITVLSYIFIIKKSLNLAS